MPDRKSERYQKTREEMRELVQLAVEELIKQDGCIPSCASVARELGLASSNRPVRNAWDWLHEQGKLPERPHRSLPRRVAGERFGEEGGGLFLEAEVLLRRIGAEIGNSSPEYRQAAQVFWVRHLEVIITLAESAMAYAVGGTVDELISSINEKGR